MSTLRNYSSPTTAPPTRRARCTPSPGSSPARPRCCSTPANRWKASRRTSKAIRRWRSLQGLDAAALDVSEKIAADGAQLARDLGLQAEPLISSTMATASEAIVDAAEELERRPDRARLPRVCAAFKATLLGSTSANVLHHATRPTLVIPSDDVAGARRSLRTATPSE
jgi:hypothetical protein